MAILPVLQYPDSRLQMRAQKVERFDAALKTLIENMWETMYHHQGIGLAATQVDHHLQVVVMDIKENGQLNDPVDGRKKLLLINPRVLSFSQTYRSYKEGCLSVKGFYEEVERPDTVNITYQDEYGNHHELYADALLATCIQHEMDHLNGKVFVDHLSKLKRQRIQQKIKKYAS